MSKFSVAIVDGKADQIEYDRIKDMAELTKRFLGAHTEVYGDGSVFSVRTTALSARTIKNFLELVAKIGNFKIGIVDL